MGFKSIEVLFDNEFNIYRPGETMYGQVKLTADSPKKIRGIIARIVGEAKTKWTKTRIATTTIYKDNEKYFHAQLYVMGSPTDPGIVLPSGINTFRFSYTLPLSLPSSFESEFGQIRYRIKIILERPSKNTNAEFPFTVIAPFHLMRLSLNELFQMSLEKSFCSFCSNVGQLSVTTTISMRGIVSGDLIPITCLCDNASQVGINGINFVLSKCVTYKASQPKEKHKIMKETVADIVTGPVNPGGTYTFNKNIEIPILPNLLFCSIISIEYDLHVKCFVKGPHRNLSGKMRLVVSVLSAESDESIE